MVNLKGKGSMSGKNLLVVAYDSSIGKGDEGKLNFLDVQLDHRDPSGPGQSNLHAVSKEAKNKDGSSMTGKDGKSLYNHNVNYYDKQLTAIKEVAGPNQEPLLNKEGEAVGTVYAVKGNLMSNPRGPGLMVNTKEGALEQSDEKLGPDTMKDQYASASAAAKEARAAKAAQKDAPEQESAATYEAGAEGVEATEANADEPAFG